MRKRGEGLSISFVNWHKSVMSNAEERQAKREAERKKRLAAELRANLQRRKTQTRARRAGDEDGRDGLPASAAPRANTPESAD